MVFFNVGGGDDDDNGGNGGHTFGGNFRGDVCGGIFR